MNYLLVYYPWLDSSNEQRKILDLECGAHHFLRRIKAPIRERLAQLVPHQSCPQSLLFGSPHLDNYVRTNTGMGLADFDRAIVGPYISDWCYSLLSLGLKQLAAAQASLPYQIYQTFTNSYVEGLTNPKQPYPLFRALQEYQPKKWELSPQLYWKKQKGWIKKAKRQPLPTNDPLLLVLLDDFFANLAQGAWQERYKIVFAGIAKGSLGRHHTIVALTANNNTADDDANTDTADHEQVLLLDLKPALNYRNPEWPHDQWYHHQFAHEGQRMLHASRLLAPEVTAGESFATVNGVQYWGREIPTLNRKIKRLLKEAEVHEFARVIAWQLGQGHALAVNNAQDVDDIIDHLTANHELIYQSIEKIREEMLEAWQYYCLLVHDGERG